MAATALDLAASEARRFTSRGIVRVLVVIIILGSSLWGLLNYFGHSTYPNAIKQQVEDRLNRAGQSRVAEIQACMKGREFSRFTVPPMTKAECEREWNDFLQSKFPESFRYATLARVIWRISPLFFLLSWLLGASYVGADWSAGQMAVSVQWEPRRLRLIGSKAVVCFALVFSAALITCGLLLLVGLPAGLFRGTFHGVSSSWWTSTIGLSLRVALVTAFGVLGGFSTASLARRTSAALVVVSIFWLLELYAEIFRSAPLRLFRNIEWFTGGSLGLGSHNTTIQAGAVLGGITATLLAAAMISMRFRDIT